MYRRYQRLLKDHWLENGICWTIVVPDDGKPLTVTEIGERLSGGAGHVVHEVARAEDAYPAEAAWAVLVGQSGSATELFEYGFRGACPPVLPRLSAGGRSGSKR